MTVQPGGDRLTDEALGEIVDVAIPPARLVDLPRQKSGSLRAFGLGTEHMFDYTVPRRQESR